ncbi:SDR family NAD(P)-dependent oxidoreductase, partial [Gammaproteobacteria bacterium]|nr:SDR family NAD(P)-dependent oxidoreductase [Gammaproteobacteria bacterium]
KNSDRLKEYANILLEFIKINVEINFADLAYTLQIGREGMDERLGIIIESKNDLENKLKSYIDGKENIDNVFNGQVKPNKEVLAFSNDEEFQNTLEQWIAHKKYARIIDLWTKGLSFDWNKLYGNNKPKKISAPTYPFAKESYWIETNADSTQLSKIGSKSFLHPLLQENNSNISELKYSSVFTGDEFFLKDHVVNGRKILPGVAYLEMARAAAFEATHDSENIANSKPIILKNILWARPIIVDDKPQTINIALYSDNQKIDYEVRSDTNTIYSQGQIIVGDKLKYPDILSIDSIIKRCKNTMNAADIYNMSKSQGIEYGSSFQGIKNLNYSNEEVLANLEFSNLASGYILNPAILDSAIQASIVLNSTGDMVDPYVPFAIKELRIYDSLENVKYSYVKLSDASKDKVKKNSIKKLDIFLLDEAGNVLLEFKELLARPMSINLDKDQSSIIYAKSEWYDKNLDFNLSSKIDNKLIAHCLNSSFTKQIDFKEIESEFRKVFNRLKECLSSKPKKKEIFLYSVKSEIPVYLYAPIVALFKTASLENPKITGRVIKLPKDCTTKQRKIIEANEIKDLEILFSKNKTNKVFEVRYLNKSQRQINRLIEKYIDKSSPKDIIKSGGVYLITGGAGGLGKHFSKYINNNPSVKIIITGRSKNSKQTLSDSSNLIYKQCDITKLEDVELLFKTIYEKYGHINGIIHSAGLIKDNFIINKLEKEIDEVMAPKIKGALNLHKIIQKHNVDWVVFFSSMAGTLGNLGQADYAGANAFLDSFATTHNYKSIAWPLWKDGGMHIDSVFEKRLEDQTGMYTLKTDKGLEAFANIVASDEHSLLVVEGDPNKLRHNLFNDKDENDIEEISLNKNEPAVDSTDFLPKLEDNLIKLCAQWLKVSEADLDINTDLSEYGVDSILMMQLLNLLEAKYKKSIPPSIIAEQRNIHDIAAYLIQEGIVKGESSKVLKSAIKSSKNNLNISTNILTSKYHSRYERKTNTSSKIAIISASCRLPKSNSLEDFWEHLKSGHDLITESSNGRWDENKYFNPDKSKVDSAYTMHAGYLENVADFDANYFGIKDEEAVAIDPQHRIILELSQELFDSAGYEKSEMSGTRTGVYIGAKENNYSRNSDGYIPDEALQHTIVNNIGNMIAARIADFYNLTGTAEAIDTACSSSLVAIHHACQAIISGEVKQAIAGGIYIMVDPFSHIAFSRAKVLSDDGKSYVFDERAKGFVMGEGAGLVLLKDYDEAINEGDQILGVILGSAVNNDGKTMGLTVPNQEGQKNVIEGVLKRSQINPETITYLEAHGTGTLLGDPIEIKAATEVYRSYTNKVGYCATGSVKSNLGHTMMAAGITSLIKVILALKNKQIPATLNCEKPHPRFGFKESPFYPNTKLTEWNPEGGIRRAAISSFGFGGTNAHLIIEQAPDDYTPNRSSLPFTVFNRKHFWLGDEVDSVDDSIKSEKILLPSLDFNFSYDEPLLKDHQIFNDQVLMGVAHLSMVIDYIKKYYPKKYWVLEKSLWSKAFVLDPNETGIVTIKAVEQTDGSIELKSYSNSINHPTENEAANFNLRWLEQNVFENIDLKKLQQQSIDHFFAADIFYHNKNQACYGSSLESVIAVDKLPDNQFLGEIKLTDIMTKQLDAYQVHPALIDACHVVSTLSMEGDPIMNHWVPLFIKEVQLSPDINGQKLKHSYVLINPKQRNNQIAEFDIQLLDESGQVKMILNGFTTKSVPSKEALFSDKILDEKQIKSPTTLAESNFNKIQGNLEEKVQNYIKTKMGAILKQSPQTISMTQNFMDMGLESSAMIGLTKNIEQELAIDLYPTLFFEYQNISSLSNYFAEEYPDKLNIKFGGLKQASSNTITNIPLPSSNQSTSKKRLSVVKRGGSLIFDHKQSSNNKNQDIAIIGMSGYLAQSDNLDQFWDHLKESHDLVTEIPDSHWDYHPWFDKDIESDNKTYSKWGSFLEHIDKFDPLFFGVSPRQAEWMDPQLRLLLQSAYETFENAGVINTIRGSNTSVYVGCCFHEYWDEVMRANTKMTGYEHSSSVMSSLSGFLSYTFDLQGGSVPLDNACASSLTALHLGMEAIKRGESRMAVIAGLNVLLSPTHYLYFSKIRALSPTGRCHTFDKKADGYVPGEGVVSVLIKSLDQALIDGDHIHAVLKGSAINHTGRSNNPTSPRPELQTKLLLDAWKNAGINPEQISYIEAHGTGTELGDPIEINALKKAFKKHTTKKDFCKIGSAKAHIGHLEGAAGLASVIKVILMMQNKTIPRMPNFEEQSPHIVLKDTPFTINTKTENWQINSGEKRLAGVNSFGMTGNNAHVIIEEYIPSASFNTPIIYPILIVLTAKNLNRLKEYVNNLLDFIKTSPEINLADLAYTLQIGREGMDERLGIIVESREDLETKLKSYIDAKDNIENVYSGQVKKNKEYLSLFTNDEELDEAINKWIEHGKLNKLLDLWTKGLTFDWNKLYGDIKPKKISAPTYPFAKERYWVDALNNSNPLVSNERSALHVLIDNNESTFSEQIFKKVLSPETFYLRDHIVNGHIWLPGTGYLEMARAAGELAANQEVTKISDVMWLRPISLEKESLTVNVSLTPDEDSDSVHFEIFSQAESPDRNIYCEGQVSYAPVICEKEPLDLDEIRKRCTKITKHERIYERLIEFGFDYKAAFQTSIRFYTNDTEVLQELNLPPGFEDTSSQFTLHPCLMDGALRTLLGHFIASDDEASLSVPFAMDSLIIYKPVKGKCFAYSKIDNLNTLSDSTSGDVIICNEEGQIAVIIEGFRSRFAKAAFTKINDELCCYQTVWKNLPLLKYKDSSTDISDTCLIIGNPNSFTKKELSKLNKISQKVIWINLG